ncbi:DNA recombination protein RmuC [Martelella alba]|uniref:DNA recombination protein RmuC homolog n=1 Tax=Martelella alba TaxID=2590451 RepID=A0A506UB16_9HYPH|nr:DNA recombination protein RmuC [Martelella alba]TPW30135.1 DNA recombination protein RmuC [Martelella alba]
MEQSTNTLLTALTGAFGGVLPFAVAVIGVLTLALSVFLFLASRRNRHGQDDALAEQMNGLMRSQIEMQGRMATMAELFGTRQAELNQSLGNRLDGLSQRLGTSLNEQTRATHANLARLQERLAVIDAAQNNIQSLAKDVVGLQAILSNKQTRGAFGQSRMETIIADALPAGSYRFQAGLSNGTRPDCLISMPNAMPPLVIDAKFPLEAWNAMNGAEDDMVARQEAQRFRRDFETHIRDIAQKYLIPGETQDTAFLFIPSESIFADVHERFESLVQKAHHARIVIVSPTLLLLSIQVIQAMLKDQRMREQAHLIQSEVAHLLGDLGRLNDRVTKLQSHFGQARQDIEQIQISSAKILRRGERIGGLEFEQQPAAGDEAASPSNPLPEQGKLKLRIVEED